MRIINMFKEIWSLFIRYSYTKTVLFIIMLVIFSAISFVQPIISGEIILYIRSSTFSIVPIILFFINFTIPKIASLISTYNSDLLSNIVQTDLKTDIFHCLLYSKHLSTDKSKGEIVTSLHTDTSIILNIGKLMISFSANVLSAIIAAIGLIIYNPLIFLVSLFIAIIIYTINYTMNRNISSFSQKKYELTSSYRNTINDIIFSYEEMKFQNPFSKIISSIKILQKQIKYNEINCDVRIEMPGRFLDLINGMTPVIGYIIGIILFKSDYRQLSLIVITTSYMTNFWRNISFVSFIKVLSAPLINSFDRINELLKLDSPSNETTETIDHVNNIEIQNISFSYDGINYVFNGYSTCVPKNGFITLCGVSGSGKSTLLKMLLKEIIPQNGGIFINGVSLSIYSDSYWRSITGYMAQSGHLFSGTIRENIELYNSNYDEIYINDVAQKLNIINEMGINFLDVNLKENNIGLSVGQKDRIRLLCILAKKPKILLLDEPSSGLDEISIERIKNLIIEIKNDILIICATHDRSIINNSDFVITINDSGDR